MPSLTEPEEIITYTQISPDTAERITREGGDSISSPTYPYTIQPAYKGWQSPTDQILSSINYCQGLSCSRGQIIPVFNSQMSQDSQESNSESARIYAAMRIKTH